MLRRLHSQRTGELSYNQLEQRRLLAVDIGGTISEDTVYDDPTGYRLVDRLVIEEGVTVTFESDVTDDGGEHTIDISGALSLVGVEADLNHSSIATLSETAEFNVIDTELNARLFTYSVGPNLRGTLSFVRSLIDIETQLNGNRLESFLIEDSTVTTGEHANLERGTASGSTFNVQRVEFNESTLTNLDINSFNSGITNSNGSNIEIAATDVSFHLDENSNLENIRSKSERVHFYFSDVDRRESFSNSRFQISDGLDQNLRVQSNEQFMTFSSFGNFVGQIDFTFAIGTLRDITVAPHSQIDSFSLGGIERLRPDYSFPRSLAINHQFEIADVDLGPVPTRLSTPITVRSQGQLVMTNVGLVGYELEEDFRPQILNRSLLTLGVEINSSTIKQFHLSNQTRGTFSVSDPSWNIQNSTLSSVGLELARGDEHIISNNEFDDANVVLSTHLSSSAGDYFAAGEFTGNQLEDSEVRIIKNGSFNFSDNTLLDTRLVVDSSAESIITDNILNHRLVVIATSTDEVADDQLVTISNNSLLFGATALGAGDAVVDLTNNWWGIGDSTVIRHRNHDRTDDSNLPLIDFEPFKKSGPGVPTGLDDLVRVTLSNEKIVVIVGNNSPVTHPASGTLVIDGYGGNDTLELTTSHSAKDTVTFSPGLSQIQNNNVTIEFENFELLEFETDQAIDTARLIGTEEQDVLLFNENRTIFNSPTRGAVLNNFATLVAHGQGGRDVANLGDTQHKDRFISRPIGAFLSNSVVGNAAIAVGFEEIAISSTRGGKDTAYIEDTAGDDEYFASPTFAQLKHETGQFYAGQFFDVVTKSVNGGADKAFLQDSPLNDRFIATPVYASISDNNTIAKAVGFSEVTGNSREGFDTAFLTDSLDDDTLEMLPQRSTLKGPDYELHALKFANVFATSSGGDDLAIFHDSVGDDVFVAKPGSGLMRGTGYQNFAVGFSQNSGISRAGGNDLALLRDSSGDDQLFTRGGSTTLKGDDFFSYAAGFRRTQAVATNGGRDEAFATDTTLDDLLGGSGTEVWLSNDESFRLIKGFTVVNANSNQGGFDRSIVEDVSFELNEYGNWN